VTTATSGRAARAFGAHLLYALIALAFSGLVSAAVYASYAFVSLGETGMLVVEGICAVLTLAFALLLAAFETIGLLRMAIYNRFGAAFQWGACARMLFHELGGVVKIALAYFLVTLVLAVPVVLAAVALMPAVLGMGLTGLFAGVAIFEDAYTQEAMYEFVAMFGSAYALVACAGVVVDYLVMVVSLMFQAVVWRAFGNWAALFDVPSWGGMYDPLPYQRDKADAGDLPDAQATGGHAAPAPQAAPEKHCHPLLLAVLCLLTSIALGLGASAGVLVLIDQTYVEGAPAFEDFGEFVDELLVEIEADVERELGSVPAFEDVRDFVDSTVLA